jgi:uncharacterized protein YjiS (DUF1127 family)
MIYASTSPSSANSFSGVAQSRRGAQLMVLAFVAKAIVSAPVKLIATVAEQRRMARAVNELEALSDRTLADIGIQRQEIPHVVRYGRG